MSSKPLAVIGSAASGTREPRTGRGTNMEGGKGTKPKVVKFQRRPDPLAR
jgi:hypothetical protein